MKEEFAEKLVQGNEMYDILSESEAGGSDAYPDLHWYASESERKCGLKYVPSEPDNDILHAMQHDEYLNGPELFELRALEPIDMVSGYPLFLIDANVIPLFRRQLKHIAFVAQREMSDFPAGYDGSITEADERLYIVADGDRGIAMVLTAIDEYSCQLIFTKDGRVKQPLNSIAQAVPRQKIARIWVAKAYRNRGMGAKLVMAVAKSLKSELADIGWELPPTTDGKKLIQKLLPSQWWGCGDAYALKETLDAAN